MDPKSQQLPAKESALFKKIFRCYEQKQFKLGLKFCKQILSNFPNHGETQSMKGMTMNCLGRKEEAYELVRLGLRNNLRSHICWHVFGMLQRSDKKYDEAIKCYRNALKWDKDNLQILRDLSLLQIQMRDLEGFKETRIKLFELRPTHRASWIGYAMSNHLLKDYPAALKILEEFRKTLQKQPYDFEYSELLMYQNMVMREAGQLEEALEHIKTYKEFICDKVASLEIRGEILLSLGRHSEAEKYFRLLIDHNHENKGYYIQLEEALKITSVEEKLQLYEEYSKKFPRAHMPRRLPLNYATGSTLRTMLDEYLCRVLRKGVPSLFTDLRPLYARENVPEMLEELVEGHLRRLESIPESESSSQEPASVVFALLYLAEHHSHLGRQEQALAVLNRAIQHTPTLVELHVARGAVLKASGDVIGAADALSEAAALDTADRCVNSVAAGALLAADKVAQAQDMCAKFTREGVSAMENLNEMQCMWFLTDTAHAYHRLGQYGNALKMCHQLDRHFTEIVEDQFDFHTYCMRKMTLCSYVRLLRLEDVLRSNEFFWQCACLAIEIYLGLHDEPLSESTDGEIDTTNMTAAELKKRAKQKKNKKEDKRKEEEKKKKQQQSAQEDGEGYTPPELVPHKLERPSAPLSEALVFLRPLQALLPRRPRTHLLAFQVALRRQRPLLMLQSLKRAHALDAAAPELATCGVQFLRYVARHTPRPYAAPEPQEAPPAPARPAPQAKPGKTAGGNKKESKKKDAGKGVSNGPAKPQAPQQNGKKEGAVDLAEEEKQWAEGEAVVCHTIQAEARRMFGTLEPQEIADRMLKEHPKSVPHRLQVARCMMFMDAGSKARAVEVATTLEDDFTGKTLESLQAVLAWLEGRECRAGAEEVAAFKRRCNAVFPRAGVFQPPTPPGATITTTTTTAGAHQPPTTTQSLENSMQKLSIATGPEIVANHSA